ncbi:antibiotic biosynthesis monooxygenase [Geodermatophilus sp. URMC 63]
MYARTTTIHADPRRVDDGIAHIREVVPAILGMRGCVSFSLLVDRASGLCLTTTVWDDHAAMRATAQSLASTRVQTRGIMGNETEEVQEWEVAVTPRLYDAPEGACTRVVWSKMDVHHVDRVLDAYRMTLVSQLEDMPGFSDVSLLIDRVEGRAVSAVTFDSREAMEASRDDAQRMRDTFGSAMEVSITDVAEFEQVLALPRVPEIEIELVV